MFLNKDMHGLFNLDKNHIEMDFKTGVINDPLDHAHCHHIHLKIVLFCEIFKSVDVHTDVQYHTNDMCDNSDD